MNQAPERTFRERAAANASREKEAAQRASLDQYLGHLDNGDPQNMIYLIHGILANIPTTSGKGQVPPLRGDELLISENLVRIAGGLNYIPTAEELSNFHRKHASSNSPTEYAWIYHELNRLSQDELKSDFCTAYSIVEQSRGPHIQDWKKELYLPVWAIIISMEDKVKKSFLGDHPSIMEVSLAKLMAITRTQREDSTSWLTMLRCRQNVKAVDFLRQIFKVLMEKDNIEISDEDLALFKVVAAEKIQG